MDYYKFVVPFAVIGAIISIAANIFSPNSRFVIIFVNLYYVIYIIFALTIGVFAKNSNHESATIVARLGVDIISAIIFCALFIASIIVLVVATQTIPIICLCSNVVIVGLMFVICIMRLLYRLAMCVTNCFAEKTSEMIYNSV